MLDVHNLQKAFGATTALDSLTLHVPENHVTALIGPSGCGKSTLLRVLLGLIQPDAGEVRIGGQLLTPDTWAAIRRRTGYVIQHGGLFPHLTARANITLLARRLHRSPTWMKDRLATLLGLTHLTHDQLDRYPAQLSGGQRQRVALMRALFLDPDVLLLDEPLGALDPLIRSSLQDDLRALLHDLAKTTLLVTHDLAEAAWFSDDIVLLREGRLVQRGSLAELHRNPADEFVQSFIEAQRSVHLVEED